MEVYFPLCQQYAAMAQSFYSQYQQSTAGKGVLASIEMEQTAICAVIFQSLLEKSEKEIAKKIANSITGDV